MRLFVLCALLMSAVALRAQPTYADDSQCPKQVIHRSNDEVLADHYAALLSGDPQRVACDYADDASVILAGTVVTGREQIAGQFAYFFSLMGGTRVDCRSLGYDNRHCVASRMGSREPPSHRGRWRRHVRVS